MLCCMAATRWVVVHAGTTAEAATFCSLLEAAGIPSRAGDEIVENLAPSINDSGMAAVEVLVPEDRADAAREIVTEFVGRSTRRSEPAVPTFRPWECPCCHEQNDGSFDICWNCQTEKTLDGS